MKNLIIILFCLVTLQSIGQTAAKFDGPSWKPPYSLTLDGWSIERFPVPIDFAPKIAYKGVEDIRFTPNWGNIHNDEYWTYAFLWYLDGTQKVNADSISNNLNYYYDGLISRNIEKRHIPANLVTKTKTSLQQISAEQGDMETYKGTVTMLDYMGQQPMVLNCMVHIKKCEGRDNTIIFHQLSPKPFNDAMWQKLNKLWADFNCN
jgi:hypothetical protein